MSEVKIRNEGAPVFGDLYLTKLMASTYDAKHEMIEALLAAIMKEHPYIEIDEALIRLVLDEALVNSIKHGNKYDVSKNVTVKFFGDEKRWGISITDEGEGIALEDIIPIDNANEEMLDHGRGVLLMSELMSEVRYYDSGRTLWMTLDHPRKGFGDPVPIKVSDDIPELGESD
ncbi:MAG: ATP-binding protein [Planctomycetes bacterium]|nr:ATP-binding protein [Planctomycetota bacterium]